MGAQPAPDQVVLALLLINKDEFVYSFEYRTHHFCT